MADDTVDPIGQVPPSPGVTPGGRRPGAEGSHQGRLRGEVVAVHRRVGHHDRGHVLDASVGAQTHSEVVIRVDSEDLSALVGKQVSIHFLD